MNDDVDRPLDTQMTISMGPQHPSTHGVLRLELVMDGDFECPDCAASQAILARVEGGRGTVEPDVAGQDLEELRDLIEGGKVTPVIEASYPLSASAEAVRHRIRQMIDAESPRDILSETMDKTST